MPNNDPVKIMVNEANAQSAIGNHIGALSIVQQALGIAEEANKNDKNYLLRLSYAKMQCAMKMHQHPEYYTTAIKYISDVLASDVFDKFPQEMFLLYFHLADISILNKDLSTARSAIKEAASLSQDDYDTLRCDVVKGKIAVLEGNHTEAVTLFQKTIDILNLKLISKDYENSDECYMIEQNLASTLNDMAIAYQINGDSQHAMIYVKKAIDVAKGERLEVERAVFLNHLAEMLFDDEAYDFVIEKATMAREIFKRRGYNGHLIRCYNLLGNAYYRQGELVLSRKSFSDAFEAVEETSDKLFFCRIIAQLSAELGDECSLNQNIAFIRAHETFDDNHTISMFENWINNLQRICCYVLPDDFKDQPDTFFMYDEEDPIYVKLKDDILNIYNSSKSVTEQNDKIMDYFKQLSEETSKQTESNSDSKKTLSRLLSKLHGSDSLSEKAQLMYEIGAWYYCHQNDTKANIWLLKAMNATEASNHTILWSRITIAQIFMNRKTTEDDKTAGNILNEVAHLIETSTNYEAIAFCRFNQGRLEARKGNFKSALRLFEQSQQALEKGKVDNPALKKEIKDNCNSVIQYMHFEDNPTEDLSFLQSELLFLQTWYPEYSQQLTEYWWYYRGNEPLSNMRISGDTVCVIYSDDVNEINWYSEALRYLFAHCMFASKTSQKKAEHMVNRTIPVPCNTPFPYSMFMVNDKKIDGKVYGYHQQVDGSKQIYAYTRLQDIECFDKSRDPQPITLSFLGYSYPESVIKITPMIDELGSSGWWIGTDINGSINSLMNLVSRFGLIPVFHMNDINDTDEITILRNKRIDIPFTTIDKVCDERKSIQKELSHMTSITDQLTLITEFDKVIDQIGELPNEGVPLISIHLAIVRFGYYVWSEAPVKWRVYPVIIINPEDDRRNTDKEIHGIISKSVAIRDAVNLTQRISFLASQNHHLDKYYIKNDALKLLELSEYIGDKDMFEVANTVLKALDHLDTH